MLGSHLSALDRRIHAWREDLASVHLKGKIDAPRFVESAAARVKLPIADLRQKPSDEAPLETQLCFGARFDVYDEKDGWAWGQAAFDDYVGYIKCDQLDKLPLDQPPLDKHLITATHIVCQRQTLVFAEPSPTARKVMALGMGAEISVEEEVKNQTLFAKIKSGGFIPAQHLKDINDLSLDFVAVAESLIGVPYLWGGRDTRSGIDCSALVQLALLLAGHKVRRDSDMQEKQLGEKIKPPLERGDFVFWKAHVGIMLDPQTLLHANAHHMAVAQEKFLPACERIEKAAGAITSIKRLNQKRPR